MKYILIVFISVLCLFSGVAVIQGQQIEDNTSWIPKKYIDEYKGDTNELLWLIVLTLQDSGVNMDRIEKVIIDDRVRQGLATTIPVTELP